MAHIIIKSDKTKQQERNIMRQFGGNGSAEHREFAECINARTNEAVNSMRKEGARIWK